ncbi:aldehyde dehydrogenase family protein [Variovorax sp. ZS18.2.2]|uniref:aldehyde dehydrogenase family protein n=1 Tax=Variovorax sp. ZS18.2.2 TaxID=2971255 RepID=UPI0027E56F77|nr:aldehyde dehydrogenase family protein [Variovorax sp. ZS18.2.2]
MEIKLPPGVRTELLPHYINGAWVEADAATAVAIIDPATEDALGRVGMADAQTVERAVDAARRAFDGAKTPPAAERAAWLQRVIAAYQPRLAEFAATISREMGAPIGLCEAAQAPVALGHLAQMLSVLETFPFEKTVGSTRVLREPVGVCGLITPWNWPIHQVICKVLPALAAGCTVVLKPSEYSPMSANLLAEVLHAAGTPPGVFNLVHGAAQVGQLLAEHPAVDMVSFTGSTPAGIDVARRAAATVKRVHQELGGKSAFIVLPDSNLERAVENCVRACYVNSGQSCNAPTRLLVPAAVAERAAAIAGRIASGMVVGHPADPATEIGPLVNARQFQRVQGLIQSGIDEGAKLVCGGVGRPAERSTGYFVRPTVFADVTEAMRIAREEIFGPVLSIIAYGCEEDAVRIANATDTGLAGYVWSDDVAHAQRIGVRLRVGNVHINDAGPDLAAPFGGYKRSGNGREFGEFGLDAFLEHKAMLGIAIETAAPQRAPEAAETLAPMEARDTRAPARSLERSSSAGLRLAPRMPAPARLCNLDRLIARMKQAGLDGIVAMYATNQYYLSSYGRHHTIPEEIGMFPVVIARHAPEHPILLMPDIDVMRLSLQPTWIQDVRPYATVLPLDVAPRARELRRFVPHHLLEGNELKGAVAGRYAGGMAEALTGALRDLGLSGGKVGFDNLGVGMGLVSALPSLQPLPAENHLRYVRQQKTGAELDLLRQATRINQTAQLRAIRQWAPGMTFRELVFAFQVEALALGGNPNLPDTMALSNTPGADWATYSDPELTDHELVRGQHVIFDCHGNYNGYCWDGGKTWVIDADPSPTARRNWAATVASLAEINRAARPGARTGELAEIGHRIFRKHGLNDDGVLIYFHGLGLDHVDMDLSAHPRGDWPLERDSMLTTHIYCPGASDERVFIEDIVHVRDNGIERLFTWDDELL